MWGYREYTNSSLVIAEGSDIKLFKSTFHVDYPQGYKGPLVPGDRSSLSYLALGDSYSSGEGDVDKDAKGNKYYTLETDRSGSLSEGIPREKCHISTRSYPYLLARWSQLGSGESRSWGSVACSGSRVYDVNQENRTGYEGQYSGSGDTRLGRLNGLANKDLLQAGALNELIPGRKKQIEFVERYRPKVVTLTMGGNDVGFGEKIQACAGSVGSCAWANEKKSTLGSQIRSQFNTLVDLYDQLRDAGDNDMKVYVIGYPQFISDSSKGVCKANVGLISMEERRMIVQAVRYMNDVIAAAAAKAGVKYIDISDALYGGRLCEGRQEYVTGVVGVAGWNGNEIQESYHPNFYGHVKMTQKIKAQLNNESLFTYSHYPRHPQRHISVPVSGDFLGDGPTVSYVSRLIADSRPVKGGVYDMNIRPGLMRAESSLRVEIGSSPVGLGEFSIADDGSFSGRIVIPPSLPAGQHTVHVTGLSNTGDSIELTQTVTVTGPDALDADDNDILDKDQACGAFVSLSGQDADLDGIDDACDPNVTDPVLYVARNGNELHGEDPRRIYLFRNTRASSITGISNDYVGPLTDINGKGALLASSSDAQTEGRVVKLILKDGAPIVVAEDDRDVCFALEVLDYLSPVVDPRSINYRGGGFKRLADLPKGVGCE